MTEHLKILENTLVTHNFFSIINFFYFILGFVGRFPSSQEGEQNGYSESFQTG